MLVKLLAFIIVAGVAASCNNAYDYIVVGGGTAGVAVAARLSQGLPSARILLLEAGPAAWDDLGINVPGKKGSTLGGTYDWNFTTAVQPDAENRTFAVNRGKVLGGSSALNLMTYNRAAQAEYDAWADLGNVGWDWSAMLAAMTKSENFTGANTSTYSNKGVGTDGPVHAVINRYIPTQQLEWIPTLNNMGVASNLESLGGSSIGVMWQPSSIDPTHYNRSYSANAYMPLAGTNLEILTNTAVAKIDLSNNDNENKKAIGVTLQNGTAIGALKEVILAAGAVQSPQLLELSGIGNASILAAAGIPVTIELSGVGENLQDHLRMQTSYQLKSNYTSFDIFKYNSTYATEQLALWEADEFSHYDYTGSGYTLLTWDQMFGDEYDMLSLAEEAAAQYPGVVNDKKLELMSDTTVPQVEVIFSDGYTGVKGYPASSSSLYGENFFTLIAVSQHPMAIGNIHINASDPSGNPVINPNYMSTEYDRKASALMAKFSRQIAQTAPLSEIWVDEYEPGLDAVVTDEDWEGYALDSVLSIYHPSGTCAMLPKTDGGVVNANLTVYGTSNLRVVDASIVPLLVSGHLQTAVYGIAEIAAEMIIADAQNE